MKKIVPLIVVVLMFMISSVSYSATPEDEAYANAAISHYKGQVYGKTISQVNRIFETTYDRVESFGDGKIYYYCVTATVCVTAHFNSSGKCFSLGMAENY